MSPLPARQPGFPVFPFEGGDAIEIGFNVTYLIDVLANSAHDMVKLELQDSAASALFSIPEQPGFKYVVMPMRI
jgi:DNA polymerase-3 subunit beta